MISESTIGAAVDAATSAPASTPANPASTPAATPASPSTPAPASTPAQRAGLARRSTLSPAPSGAPGGTATVRPAAPSTTPTTTPDLEDPNYAVPPQAEWEGILTNARAKAAEDARRELAEQYGSLTPDLWQSHFKSYFEGLQNNPVEFHRWLGDQLARRGLNVSPPPAPAEPMTLPQPSLYADAGDGRRIPAYSADDMLRVIEVTRHQINAELDQRLQPLEATAHDAKVTRIMTVANQQAAAAIADAETWPYFSELREDIAKIMSSDKRFSFEGAYTRALKERMPQFKTQARAAVLDELGKAPAAPTAINPSRPVINGTQGSRRLTLEEKFERALHDQLGH